MLSGWKTVIFNALAVVFAGVEAGQFADLIPDAWESTAVAVVAGINLLLRFYTNSPVGKAK